MLLPARLCVRPSARSRAFRLLSSWLAVRCLGKTRLPDLASSYMRLYARLGEASSDIAGDEPDLEAASAACPVGLPLAEVAAVVRQADAASLAQALQKKKFPAFVTPPDADHFYRVEVGPYVDAQLANAARQKLEEQGFKISVKRGARLPRSWFGVNVSAKGCYTA